jgi:hypothetical protein
VVFVLLSACRLRVDGALGDGEALAISRASVFRRTGRGDGDGRVIGCPGAAASDVVATVVVVSVVAGASCSLEPVNRRTGAVTT